MLRLPLVHIICIAEKRESKNESERPINFETSIQMENAQIVSV